MRDKRENRYFMLKVMSISFPMFREAVAGDIFLFFYFL